MVFGAPVYRNSGSIILQIEPRYAQPGSLAHMGGFVQGLLGGSRPVGGTLLRWLEGTLKVLSRYVQLEVPRRCLSLRFTPHEPSRMPPTDRWRMLHGRLPPATVQRAEHDRRPGLRVTVPFGFPGYPAVSMNWGLLVVGVLRIFIRATDFWKLPFRACGYIP